MAKFVFFVLCLVMVGGMSNHAHADWCKDRYNLPYECSQHTSVSCGTHPETGETMWCTTESINGSGKSGAKMETMEYVMLSVGVAVVVLGAAWYLFHKKPSKNNPGQISLMTF